MVTQGRQLQINWLVLKHIAFDLQQEILCLVKKGASKASVARQLGIGEATVYRILKRDKNQ